MILSNIHSPEDLKSVPAEKLPQLCAEIRKKIIDTVAKNGGHLASNLGVVELTLALHRVFNSPEDAIVFDVSHQSYTHKLITGRYESFGTLRQYGGISGFTRRSESLHDFFDNGHASTSISQGLGLLSAWNIEDPSSNRKVVCVIGDGSLTGGMAFEALSHAGQLSKNLIVILNDNQMSISPSTGSISKYLSSLTMTGAYQRFRNFVDRFVDKIPNSKNHIGKIIFRLKRGVKGMFLRENFFVDFGCEYVGPLDGHNIKELEDTLSRVKKLSKPVVVHVLTKKGKGYSPAENDPASFHGVGPFQISDGKMDKFNSSSFTENFSNSLLKIAERNNKIVAITAAMSKGTGLDAFSRKFPNRFFDVGIAEEHAVTFAGGLSAGGMVPVVAIYSTFIQRAIDQIIHDCALSSFPVVLCFDRAGAVPNDGETHQGEFDIALLRPVPNMVLLSPSSATDLDLCLCWASESGKTVAIRYPKSACPSELPSFSKKIEIGKGIFIKAEEFAPTLTMEFESLGNKKKEKVLLVCTGGMFSETLQAARIFLQNGIYSDIFTLRFLKPVDEKYFFEIAKNYDFVEFIEDGVKNGGISEYLQNVLLENHFTGSSIISAFPDKFLSHGARDEILSAADMSPKRIYEKLTEMIL